jgi:uncharacterized alpha-E superfamily protein
VAVANRLGSGMLDNPGLMAYLPALSRYLLGEDLQLPSVETWWCGDPSSLGFVLANLESLAIKGVQPSPTARCVFPGDLDASTREELVARVRARPHLYVAQQRLPLSTTPVLTGGGLEPRHAVLRTFLMAREDAFAVMPGGLTRVAAGPDRPLVSNQLGGVGKDTWVIASEPERQQSLLASTGQPALTPASVAEIPSRVADNLFWMGRYAERAEGLVRLLRVIVLHITEQSALPVVGGAAGFMDNLLRALTHQTRAYPGFVGEGAEHRLADPEDELLSLIAKDGLMGGLPQTLQALVQAAWSVRDRLSMDTWRVVSDMEEELTSLRTHPPSHLGAALDELDGLVTALVAFAGLTGENMTHAQGWRFLQIGRRLERALNLESLLRATVVPVSGPLEEAALCESVLGVTDSLMAYRRRYRTGMRVAPLLDLVLQDESNPRAMGYQLARLHELVGELPRATAIRYRTPQERLVLEAITDLRLADLDRLAQVGEGAGIRADLDQLLARIGHLLPEVSDAVAARYFRHEEQPHRLLALTRRGE